MSEDSITIVGKISSIANVLEDYNGPYVVNPSPSSDVILYTENKSMINNVKINKINPNDIPNLKPENIKKGVEILGIIGTLE